MSKVEQVKELIRQMESASRTSDEKRRRCDAMYRVFLTAEAELREANRAYLYVRSQLEALAVAGLSQPSPAMPESLSSLAKADQADQAELPAVQQEQGLTETELQVLQQAEAEDNAAAADDQEHCARCGLASDSDEAGFFGIQLAQDGERYCLGCHGALGLIPPHGSDPYYADPDCPAPAGADAPPASEPETTTQVIEIPAPPSRVAAFVRAAEREKNRVQSMVKALDVEQKAESVPVIFRQRSFQSIGEAFTRPVFELLTPDKGPVALATIQQKVRGLYTSETTKIYLRDMVASGHVKRVGTGFYAHKDWHPVLDQD